MHGQRRRFAQVVYIILIGEAEHQNPRTLHGFSMLVQRRAYRGGHVIRHCGIDLARQLNESSMEVELFRLPRKIEWIDGNAMSAQPRPRIERLKTKRFGRSRLNYLPDINS